MVVAVYRQCPPPNLRGGPAKSAVPCILKALFQEESCENKVHQKDNSGQYVWRKIGIWVFTWLWQFTGNARHPTYVEVPPRVPYPHGRRDLEIDEISGMSQEVRVCLE
jgi:hypothetical protein